MVCESLVVCERVVEDAQTGALTMFSCIERITAFNFPSMHHGFACAARYRWEGTLPEAPTPVQYRFVRCSEIDGEEAVTELDGEWRPDTNYARVWVNFGFLRLRRNERLTFRIDHRVGKSGEWDRGHEYSFDVVKLELTEEQRETLRVQLKALGLPARDTDGGS